MTTVQASCFSKNASKSFRRSFPTDFRFSSFVHAMNSEDGLGCILPRSLSQGDRGALRSVLLLAREMGVLMMGTVALDGTKIHANASRHSALSYGQRGRTTMIIRSAACRRGAEPMSPAG
jgi:hypothetical protein